MLIVGGLLQPPHFLSLYLDSIQPQPIWAAIGDIHQGTQAADVISAIFVAEGSGEDEWVDNNNLTEA